MAILQSPESIIQRPKFRGESLKFRRNLVSHYSAIGDSISCDAPYSAIGFRAKLLLRYPLVRPILGLR